MEKVKYIKHNKIDFSKWDDVVLGSKYPLVFAQSFYLNATAGNWDALVIGDYDCVFPLTKKIKFGIKYLPQPHFTSQLGAFGAVTPEREKMFFDFIINNFRLIEIELNASNKIESEYIRKKNTFMINYNEGYHQNQNAKRNITKALNAGLHVEICNESEIESNVNTFILTLLKQKLKLPNKASDTYKELINSAKTKGKLYSFKVIDNETNVHAFAQFISNGMHVVYLKGNHTDKFKTEGSMHLILNFAIEYFMDKAIIFDFGGGSLTEGLAEFYRGLGGKKFDYSFLQVNKLPTILNSIKSKKKKKF